ncbi:hypothetical protein JW805_20900 [Roseomonas aeriglobus]|nr:hypothetical protein [Roseomonas aeriglobus]
MKTNPFICKCRAPVSCAAVLALAVPTWAAAQNRQAQFDTDIVSRDVPPRPVQDGQTAELGANRVGQRQSVTQAAEEARVTPMARLNGRIQNRVQARIRNRIDRYYDPTANATSPFVIAGQKVQRQR